MDESVLREYGNQFYIEDDDYFQDIISQIDINYENDISPQV
jgi:hypothetical protein